MNAVKLKTATDNEHASPALTALLDHQTKIDAIQTRIDKLREAQREALAGVAGTDQSSALLSEAKTRRSRAQALIFMGNEKPEALIALDTEVEKAKAQVAADSERSESARGALELIEAEIGAVSEELATLQRQAHDMLYRHLITDSVAAHRRCVTAARELLAAYAELLGTAQAAEHFKNDEQGRPWVIPQWVFNSLPTLRLPELNTEGAERVDLKIEKGEVAAATTTALDRLRQRGARF